jgi:hypothetical protein
VLQSVPIEVALEKLTTVDRFRRHFFHVSSTLKVNLQVASLFGCQSEWMARPHHEHRHHDDDSDVVQVPLLALFGSLQPQDFNGRKADAIAAAKARAMHNLRRCVIANTDNMNVSAEMVE